MAELLHLDPFEEEPELDGLDRDGLEALLHTVRGRLAQLDECEPRNPESEAYEAWADQHEDLEDLADDILDRLDELDD